jgi:hypothetical protein
MGFSGRIGGCENDGPNDEDRQKHNLPPGMARKLPEKSVRYAPAAMGLLPSMPPVAVPPAFFTLQ